MNDAQPRHLILGTAGHIDHGKTSLVRRLTGVDTDRLPEERKRGITIDLGFASLELPGVRIGIVDVPGHERFVHNMVAGATGVDLALLVVAADDSVMPQTIEHLAILEQLGVCQGIVAVTKTDLVDADHLQLVRDELADLLQGTFLATAPIVTVSSATGSGFDELREVLARLANQYERPIRRQVFRLPIDRVFTIEGHGTVVTGTVLSGQVQVGDNLMLMPAGRTVRVRGLQSHSSDLQVVEGGQRAAINLAGVKKDELRRGDELSVAGYLEPARRLLTRVQMLATSAHPLKDRQLLRLHIGTREVTARAILKGGRIEPGNSGFVELRSQDWVLADYGQRFILRQLSPVLTVGGGIVLDPAIASHRRLRQLETVGQKLLQPQPVDRLAGFLEDHDVDELTPLALACRLGVDPGERQQLLDQLLKSKQLIRLGPGTKILTHRVRRQTLGEQILARCRRELRLRQPARSLPRATLLSACRRYAQSTTLEAVIHDLVQRGLMVANEEKIGPAGERAQLTRNQQKGLDQLVETCQSAGLTPPLLKELAVQIGQPLKEVEVLAAVAVEDSLLVRVGEGLYVTPAAMEAARVQTVAYLREHGPATVAQLRDLWGASRKYAVPLCEYFDNRGVTERSADLRSLGPRAEEPISTPS